MDDTIVQSSGAVDLETATMILVFSALGLVLLLAWTIYRINNHRKKVSRIEDLSISIGEREAKNRSSGAKEKPSPSLPKSDLLIVLYTGKDRPWRDLAKKEMRKGSTVLAVSTKTPAQLRRIYPGLHWIIWLDRSTAHKPQDGVTIINPTNLSRVMDEIKTIGTMKERPKLIIFEDFEGLLDANGPERTIRFLSMIKDISKKDHLSVLVPVSYRSMRQKTRNRLQETFETVVI